MTLAEEFVQDIQAQIMASAFTKAPIIAVILSFKDACKFQMGLQPGLFAINAKGLGTFCGAKIFHHRGTTRMVINRGDLADLISEGARAL